MQSLDQTVGLFTKPLTVKDLFTCRYCHTPPFLGRSACGKRKGKGMERSSEKGPLGPRPWVAVSLKDFLRLDDRLECPALEKEGQLG